nr:Loss of heterozygosity 11 chromosomal region 2 [Hymenolepis microstoma]
MVKRFGLVTCSAYPKEPVFLRKIELNANIVNNIADISLKFQYKNTTSRVIEAEFIYPLGPEAAVYYFDAVIKDKHILAKCRERLGSGGKWKILVQSDRNRFMMLRSLSPEKKFKMKVGDIPAGDDVVLTFKYVVPLIVEETDNPQNRLNPLSDTIVSLLSIPRDISSVKSVVKFSFTAEIYSSKEILSVISNNHNLKVDFMDSNKNHARVSLPNDTDFIQDFGLEIISRNSRELVSVFETGNASNESFMSNHCIMASFLPSFPQIDINDGRKCEVIFIIDCSGNYDMNMFGKLRDALILSLKSLPKQSRFQIISYGVDYHVSFPNPVEYSKLNVVKAMHFLTHLRTEDGGSGLFGALNLTYSTPLTEKGRFRQIILLTGGDICHPTEVIKLISENQMNTRLTVSCIGNLHENPALWAVANAGRGSLKNIRGNENLLSAAVSALRTALQPPLKAVSLNWDVQVNGKKVKVDTTPRQLPPLFFGHQMTVFGVISPSEETNSLSKLEGTVKLQYKLNDTIQSYTSKIQFPSIVHESLPIHRLAAKAKINDLDQKLADALALNVWKKGNICQKAIDISVSTNVISPFTSYFGVDPRREDTSKKPPPVLVPISQALRTSKPPTPTAKRTGGFLDIVKNSSYLRAEVVLAAEQQEYEGHWLVNKEVAKLLKISEEQMSSSKPGYGNLLAADNKLSCEEEHTKMETSCDLVAEAGPSRPYSMRFRMDFIYPTIKRDPNDDIMQVPVISSQDFNDNFDITNLTQMLENTTAETFTNEEPTRDFLEVTKDANKENEESCHGLPPLATANLTHVSKSMVPSLEVKNPTSNPFGESIVDDVVQNTTAVESHSTPQKSLSDCVEFQKFLPIPAGGFPGFKTASGNSLKAPSDEALKRAKWLLEEAANSDIRVHKDKSLSNTPVRDDKSSIPTFGFTTASGTSIEVSSSESLARAKRLVNDCKHSLKQLDDTGRFKHPCSKILKIPSEALQEPKALLEESSVHEGNIGPNVNLKGVSETAAGKNLMVASGESIKYTECSFEDSNANNKTTKPTGSSMRNTTTESADSICSIQAPKTDSFKQSDGPSELSTLPKDPLTIISTTGSGLTLKLSSIESLNSSKQLEEARSKEPDTSSMGQKNREASILNSPNPLQSGFKLASGKAIASVSEEAMKRATALLNEVAKEIKTGHELQTVSNEISPPVGGGFKLASGKTVDPVSEEAMKRAKIILNECAREIEMREEPMTSNMTTALVGSGFRSVSGKSTTPVSNEAVEQPTTPFNECTTNETESGQVEISAPKSPSLEISSSPSRKADNSELSPVLDFDGSFEISSQMMNVLEGRISQPQHNTQSLLIEEQRFALRAEQESKAESRFKPIDTSNLSASRINSQSACSRAPFSKTHRVIHEPSSPGLLWKCRKTGDRFVRDLSIPLSGPVNKELNFVDDFIRLDNPGPFSLNTASDLRFKVDSDDLQISYLLGDEIEIIPDSYGYVGCEEVARAFVCSPGVTSGLATRQWIAHHFCQLAWRFGSTALLQYDSLVRSVFPNLILPHSSIERTDGRLLLHALLLELKYRYDRELEAVKRPAVRRILERDDTPAKRMVLCVSHLEGLPNHQYRGRLTDGWYHIDWVPDPLLSRLVERGRIRVGTKLATAGAEFIQAPSGFGGDKGKEYKGEDAHLYGQFSNGLALRLNGNSTVPAPRNARLGFASHQPIANLPSTPLSSISPDGGAVSSVCVLIQKRFQLQYMETCSLEDGDASETEGSRRQHVFRDPRSEQAAERKHAEKCQRAFDKALGELTSSKGRRGRRSQPKTAFLHSLGLDGEALWNAVNNALDPGLAESGLSAAQRDAMLRYKETAMQEILSQSISKREVTQLLRLQVAGIHPQDVRKQCELPLTLWNPTEEMVEVLQEGSVVQLTRINVSTTRITDPFAPLSSSATESGQLVSLSGSRGTKVRPLKATQMVKFFKQGQPTDSILVQDLIETIYRPRRFFSIGELGNVIGDSSDRAKVVNFTAFVVGTKTTTSATTKISVGGTNTFKGGSDLGVVYLASLRGEDGEEDFSTIAVLRIWGGLERYCLNSVLSARNRVRFTDVQLKSVSKLQMNPDFPPNGSSEVNCVLLNYTAASYVTTETAPRDISVNKRFQTPWKETPQLYSFMQACMESHFQKFFSGTSLTNISASRCLRSSVCFSTPLAPTSKTESNPMPSIVNVKEQSSVVKHEVSSNSSPLTRIRTRAGLCRPRKSISAALAASTPNTSLIQNTSVVQDEFLTPSHPTPSAFSTPLPAKRPFSTNLSKMETLVVPPVLEKSSPIVKRRRSSLFASSIPMQSSRTSPRLETSNSSGFDHPVVSPNFDSDTESTEPQRTDLESSEMKTVNFDSPSHGINSDTTSTEPQRNSSASLQAITHAESSLEADSSVLLEDISSSLDVSIADLVKTRKRKCSSQTSSPASIRKKSLKLKGTQ